MKNIVICEKCNAENPVYRLTCVECNSFLRGRVNNIEFWKTFWALFHSPNKAFLNIIFAKNKNMVAPLLVLFGIKAALMELQIKSIMGKPNVDWLVFSISAAILSVILLIVFSYIITVVNKNLGLETRFKDNLSIFTYAFIPLIISLFILTGVEYALFGEYWFLQIPLAFELNGATANILFFIEVVMFLWSFVLLVVANSVQSKNTTYSAMRSALLLILVFGIPVISI